MSATPPRSRTLIALLTVLALATGCRSTGGDSASGPAGDIGAAATPQNPTTAPAGQQAASPDTTRLCGTPPCMRFASRSETRTLEDTLTNHPIVSAVAVHVVGSLLCGGILCLLGEGTGLVYIEHETKAAVAANECLKVAVLPSGAEWKIVSIKASDESPYCKD
jgi:hypothetical protein